jgi:hypothetical protein
VSADYFSWQTARQAPKAGRLSAPAPVPTPASRGPAPVQPRGDEGLTLTEHSASTTIVERIREALVRKLYRDE